MKVLLIQPSFSTHIITPPLGLGYLASFLRSHDHKVKIYDCLAKGIKNDELVPIVRKEKPDLIGVNILTIFFPQAINLIKSLKSKTRTPIVIGGPHVSAIPNFSLKETEANFAIIGEGEETLLELVQTLQKRKKNLAQIKGLAFKTKKGKIIKNKRRPLIKDLDALPFPAWDLLQPQNYPPAPHGAFYKRFPTAPIITTRGCPFNCSFCSSKVTWRGRIRFRDPNKVVDEIQLLIKKYGIREFHFEDDNFTASKKHAMAVCQEIINRQLDIVWACPNGVRINCLDEELLRIMKKSGCYLLAFGIESGSQLILDKANKRLDLKTVPKIIKTAKKLDIKTWGFFIIGLPGETRKTFEKTIRFAQELPLDRAQFCKFSPLPGTTIFKEWSNGKDLRELPWEKINFFGDCVYNTEKLTCGELTYLQKKAFRSFYFRPKAFLRTLFLIRPRQVKWIIKRLIDYSLFYLKN